MTHKHHAADEFMAGAPTGGIWAQQGFVRLQRNLRRRRKVLLAQLQTANDAVSIETIRQQLYIVDQRIETRPADVTL